MVPGVNMVEFQRTGGDHADFYQLYHLLCKAVNVQSPGAPPSAQTTAAGVTDQGQRPDDVAAIGQRLAGMTPSAQIRSA